MAETKLKVAQNQARAAPIIGNLIRSMWTGDLRADLDVLNNASTPVLIAYGTIDPLQPNGGASKYMHERINNSVLAKIVGKGHLNMITTVKGVTKLLSDFIVKEYLPSEITVFNTGCDVCKQVRVEEHAS